MRRHIEVVCHQHLHHRIILYERRIIQIHKSLGQHRLNHRDIDRRSRRRERKTRHRYLLVIAEPRHGDGALHRHVRGGSGRIARTAEEEGTEVERFDLGARVEDREGRGTVEGLLLGGCDDGVGLRMGGDAGGAGLLVHGPRIEEDGVFDADGVESGQDRVGSSFVKLQ